MTIEIGGGDLWPIMKKLFDLPDEAKGFTLSMGVNEITEIEIRYMVSAEQQSLPVEVPTEKFKLVRQ